MSTINLFNQVTSNANSSAMYGERDDLVADVETFVSPVGGSAPVFPADEGELIYLSSASANDTGVIVVVGLDENFEPQTEQVTLAGLTQVASTRLFSRINRISWASAGGSEGVVTATDQTGTNVYSLMPVDTQSSVSGVVSIPKGYTARVLKAHGAVLKDNATQTVVQFKLYVRYPNMIARRAFRFTVTSRGSDHFNYDNPLADKIPGPFDLYLTAESSSSADVLSRISVLQEKA